MLALFAVACALIWFPILYHQVSQRGLLVLVLWLVTAPILSNLITQPSFNPFFQPQVLEELGPVQSVKSAYIELPTTIRLKELLEPSRALFGMFFIVFIANVILKKRHLLHLDRTEIYMGLFVILIIVSVLLQAKRVAFGLRTASDAFIIPFLAYFITRRLVNDEQHFRLFAQIAGYTGVYLIAISVVERLVHSELFYRISGPFASSNTLYAVMMVLFFIVVLDTLHAASPPEERQALPRVSRWLVLYLAPVIVFLTLARGNWVGFLLSALIFLYMGRRLVSFPRKIAVVGVALLFTLVMLMTLPAFLPEELIERRVGNLQNVHGRFATWSAVIQEASKDPILGIGLNNLRDVLAETTTEFGSVRSYSTVHNSFLAIFSELGAIGFIMYLAIIISLIRMGLKLYRRGPYIRDRWRGVVLIAMITAYLTPALFANTLYTLMPLHHLYTYAFAGAITGVYSWRRSTLHSQTPTARWARVNTSGAPHLAFRRHEEGTY